MNDGLTRDALRELLGNERMERVICAGVTGSTNDLISEAARNGAAAGTVAVADGQTAGRGRQGRSFLSPPGQGVYLSCLLRPDCEVKDAACLTALSAVAACRAIRRVCGVSLGVKWVNDLVLGGRKLAGILCELSPDPDRGRVGHVVVGIGVNVLQESFPTELASVAASLLMETGRHVYRPELAAALIAELDILSRDFPLCRPEYLEEYRAHCVTVGREVSFSDNGQIRSALALAVDDDFGLTVRLPDGTVRTLRSGEVSVRGVCGYI